MKMDANTSRASGGLLAECYARSIELLRSNLTPAGILASSPSELARGRNYTSIFGRDAAICAIGMCASGDEELIAGARTSLHTLAAAQAPNGQIPKFVSPETGETDFWYTGCLDATLWWLLAISFHDRHFPHEKLAETFAEQVQAALRWLACQEHPQWGLLQQNEASDWADIMPRSGFVLYSNALWHRVKQNFDLPEKDATRRFLNHLFAPFDKPASEHRRMRLMSHYIRNKARPTPFYLSFVNFSFWGEEVDIFGNLLAVLFGLADTSRATSIIEGIQALQAHRPHPLRVVGRPIEPASELWRRYMMRHKQNLPWQYHNGGAWPFVGGFWVLALQRLGQQLAARAELECLALANAENDWQFNEWFHGRSGRPMGMAGQSWNAALYILAAQTLLEERSFIL